MVFYSINSRKKVFHLPHCSFVRTIKAEYRKTFDSPEEARRNHYIQCNCCSPIGQRFRKEQNAIVSSCQRNGAICYLHDGTIIITTPRSKWKIIVTGKANKLHLYHKNTRGTEDPLSPLPHYHHQKVYCKTITEYIDYIVEHDCYRMRTPLQPLPKKTGKSKSKPRKGTKRWKAQQQKEKQIAKRKAIRNVYALLDAI